MMLIAELGSSPAPEWDLRRWCETAADAGADAVKIQLFWAEHFPLAEQASKRPLEFPRERLAEFVETAHSLGLQAGASVFDADAVELAARHCDWLKLAAREQNNTDLELKAFYTLRPVYRSISRREPIFKSMRQTTLWTVERYPTPLWIAIWHAWRAAAFLNSQAVGWGWSSHTCYGLDCFLAARLGASVVEKHLALAPDNIESGHSLLPAHFKRLAAALHR